MIPLALLLLAPALARAAAPEYGILLMAHGGGADWNQCVADIRDGLEAKVPVETAFGMADGAELERAAQALEARGVGKIVAVPLFINSDSEVLDHTRYLLGLRSQPSLVLRDGLARKKAGPAAHAAKHHAGGFSLRRVKNSLPVVMTAALDSHPLIAQILLDRANNLSQDPSRESVILVGHGPVDEKADKIWLKTMGDLAQAVESEGRFKEVVSVTLRDDAPAVVKNKAAGRLRALVAEAQRQGRTIVIPFLIARGGMEGHIVDILKGLNYAWDGNALCPHPNLERWVLEVAAQGAQEESMKRY